MTNDQAYYWTPEWQAAEREADEDIAAGRVRDFDNVEALIASLHEGREDDVAWKRLTAKQFADGYADTDAVYDED